MDDLLKSVELPGVSVLPEATLPDDEALFKAAMIAGGATIDPETAPPALPIVGDPEPVVKAPEVEVKPPVEPEKVPEPAKEAIAPKLMKLMEREAAVVAREAKAKEAIAAVEEAISQVSLVHQARERFKFDPVSYIRSIAPDVDLADLAKQLWYEKLGNVAPAEYRATRAERVATGSIEGLREEFKAEQQRLVESLEREKQEAAYHQYVGAIGSFSRSVPDEYPLVKAFAAERPDDVQRGLFKIAQQHAQATNGAEVLTPSQCAERLQAQLLQLQKVFVPSAPAVVPQKVAPPTANAPTTLRNSSQSVQPSRQAPDLEDEETLFQRAVEEARKAGQIRK